MSRFDQSNVVCDRWMDYVTYSSEASLPAEFQTHMASCSVCFEEWHQLQIVWEALALDTDDIQVPDTLKSEVMDAIFGENNTDVTAAASKSVSASPTSESSSAAEADASSSAAAFPAASALASPPPLRRPRNRWGYAAAAAVCMILIIGSGIWFALGPLRNQTSPAIIAPSQTVLQEWALGPVQQTMKAAKASIQLVRDGDVQKVVVHAEGLAPTTGEQAYQVWLIYNDRRYNCGTFRVDRSGKGVLIYDLKRPDIKIDGFGVTLEPDAQGTAPRGTKVLGTSNPS